MGITKHIALPRSITRHITLPNAIIFAALFVSAPRLAAAFALVEPSLAGLPIERITGPAFGFCLTCCAVYTWGVWETKIKRLKNEKAILRVNLLLAGWVALLVLMTIMLVPPMVMELRAIEFIIPPPWDILYCIVVAVATEGVVAVTAYAKAIAEPAKPRKGGGASEGTASETSKPTAKTFVATCEFCDWTKGGYETERKAQNAENAHKRIHKEKQSL
jgi:hypothetical protein